MKTITTSTCVLLLALPLCTTANAENMLGVGAKAGTLGLGVEATWRPFAFMDFRFGANQYDFDDNGYYGNVNYDAVLNLDTFYITGNFRFPASPFRLTVGAYENGNELNGTSGENDPILFIGGDPYPTDAVGTLTKQATFAGTSPYFGVGYDLTVFGTVGLNLDFGVLWQGSPDVALSADGALSGDPTFEASLEAERLLVEEELSDMKAWPVLSLGFVVNFL